MKILSYSILATLCLLGTSCKERASSLPLVSSEKFEKTIDNQSVKLYTLKNGNITLQVTNYGARIVTLFVPDKNGNYDDIVLGFDNLETYMDPKEGRYYGSVVGRIANRIGNAQFSLDGKTYQLDKNDNEVNMLHGGNDALDCKVWKVDSVSDNAIHFSYVSPDGENGFPGTLTINMTYELTPNNELKITYKATTDKPTVINLSHHSFFNLHGEGKGSINDLILQIKAKGITPVDKLLIPDGTIMDVTGTPFDFNTPTPIEVNLNKDKENQQMIFGNGFDHNWVLDRAGEGIESIASVYDPKSGRIMEILTDQVGLQFYGGNFFDGHLKGKQGQPHRFREGMALETQKFPDAPNQPNFPSTQLNPGETYTQTCIYKFSTK